MAFHKYHLPSNVPLSLGASPNDMEECTRESYSRLHFWQRELFAQRIKDSGLSAKIALYRSFPHLNVLSCLQAACICECEIFPKQMLSVAAVGC